MHKFDGVNTLTLRCPCRPHVDKASNASQAKCFEEEEMIKQIIKDGKIPYDA